MNWTPTLGRLDEANIHIDDRAALKVSEMRATARKIINIEPKIKPIIFVDYLQIVRGDYLHHNRTEIVGQISNDLKQLVKEFDCPVVSSYQLNRVVETRENKRPLMSDLRDSVILSKMQMSSYFYTEMITTTNMRRCQIDWK